MMEFNGMGLSEITKENQIRQCVQKSCPEAGWHSGVREGQGDPQEPAKEPEKGQGAQEGRRPSEEKVSAVLGGGVTRQSGTGRKGGAISRAPGREPGTWEVFTFAERLHGNLPS